MYSNPYNLIVILILYSNIKFRNYYTIIEMVEYSKCITNTNRFKSETEDMISIRKLYDIHEPLQQNYKDLENEMNEIHSIIKNEIAFRHRRNKKLNPLLNK